MLNTYPCAPSRSEEGKGENDEDNRDHSIEEVEDNIEEVSQEEVKKALLRKVDRRMSVLVLIYILNCKLSCNTSIGYTY
jgi:hypothetical protein